MRPGQDQFRASHGGRERQAPPIRVKHGRCRKQNVVVADAKAVRKTLSQAVQHQRAMRIDHAFGFSRRAGGKTHSRRFVFFQQRIDKFIVRSGKKILVVFMCAWNLPAAERHHENAFEIRVRAEGFVNGQQDVVNDQIPVTRVICDVSKLVGMKPQIQGVQNAAGYRHAEISLEMYRVVPH